MKKYSLIFKYLKDYKLAMASYIFCTILSIFFGIASLGMFLPFLQVLFKVDMGGVPVTTGTNKLSLFQVIKEKIAELVNNSTPVQSLGIICLLIVVSIVLNLASRSLQPAKNKVSTRFRIDIFNKVLSLPIGYFTEQRKGDLMSRMTNDVGQVEGSVLSALEGWVKDPLQIIFYLIVLFVYTPSKFIHCITKSSFMIFAIAHNKINTKPL